MSGTAGHHCGLPFVPQPAPHELLGSWLLRLAQLYGLGLTTLLSRLGARSTGELVSRTGSPLMAARSAWMQFRQRHVCPEQISKRWLRTLAGRAGRKNSVPAGAA